MGQKLGERPSNSLGTRDGSDWKNRETSHGPASVTIVCEHQTLAFLALEHGLKVNSSKEGEALQPRRRLYTMR